MATASKHFDLTPHSTNALYEWWQIETTDAAFCAIPLGDGDISAALSDGTRLNVYVLERTAFKIRVTVLVPRPVSTGTTERVTLTVTDGGVASQSWLGWASTPPAPQAVGPTITFRTHAPADDPTGTLTQTYGPSDDWVHPNAYRVDHLTGNAKWLTYRNAAERDAGVGTVTQIVVDTPLPAGVEGGDKFENPCLLCTTDDGATSLEEWHADLNPVAPWNGAAGAYNSDPCLALRSDGSLYVLWRNASFQLQYRLVTGTCLADATFGAIQTATFEDNVAAPSIVKLANGTWVLFYTQVSSTYKGAVRYQTSTDEGATWSGATTLFVSTVGTLEPNAPFDRGYWHGSVAGNLAGGPMSDGYYYASYSENWVGNANSHYAVQRLWRTTDPLNGPWESCPVPHYYGSTTWDANGTYQGCVFERSDGSLAMCFSGFIVVSNVLYPTTGMGAVNLSDGQTLSEVNAWQYGMTFTGAPDTSYKTNPTNRGTVVEVDPIEYEADYSLDGVNWTNFLAWSQDASAALDTTALPDGALQFRVRARNASTLEASDYDTVSVTVRNVEYEADYSLDGATWTPLQAWGGGTSASLDTTALPDGDVHLRVRARNINTLEASGYDTVTATIANGVAVAVRPSFIVSGAAVYAPTLTEGVPPGVVAPALIPSSAAVYAPTLVEGVPATPVTIAPALIASAAQVFAPRVVAPGTADGHLSVASIRTRPALSATLTRRP